MTVSVSVRMGSTSFDGGVFLRVHRCAGAVAGACEVTVPAPMVIDASPGDPASVALGRDRLETAFTGALDSIEARGTHTVFRALDARVLAARMRVSQLFEEQSSDAILAALADAAGMPVGPLSPGVPVLAYWADDGRSVLAHLVHLAQLGGSHLFVDRNGKLQTTPPLPLPPALQLRYGMHLIEVGAAARQAGGPVEVRTEGAASVRGPQAAYWPTTDTASTAGVVRTGDGAPLRLRVPELRNMASALAVAGNRALHRARQTRRVRLTCLGIPGIELGATVLVEGIPGASAALALCVVSLEHRLNPWEGLISELRLEGVAG